MKKIIIASLAASIAMAEALSQIKKVKML
jgi:hypothetical protein